jgi:hypothetical protein
MYRTAPKQERRTVIGYTTTGDRPHACQRLTYHCTTPTPPMWIDDDWPELTREVLVATVIRHDGRWARLYNGARSICTAFAHDAGARQSRLVALWRGVLRVGEVRGRVPVRLDGGSYAFCPTREQRPRYAIVPHLRTCAHARPGSRVPL